ncbi:MAG: M24 family metallopeptidase [Chloroflexi bacterium]|nr:M24 family metallopeptidase [Chloroflexota bacterium]
MLDLSDYPRFSLAERERRWGRVRELMREHNCDCLVAPGLRDAEDQATARYLSQIGGIGISAWVVFPLDGEATAVLASDRNRAFAARMQDWITDLRVGEPSTLVPERLRELRLDRDRIGFTQFQGHYREPEGDIPYETIVRMKSLLPQAHIYGENDVLNWARLVRGPEEIAVIERVAAANEEAIEALHEIARPGLRQRDVWYAMANALTRAAGQWPARLSVTFDGPANQTLGMPIPDRIRPGALCSQEVCARIQGYRAQSNHTIQVGRGTPDDYTHAMTATIDVFDAVVAWLRPGRTIDELCTHYLNLCENHRGRDASGVVYHSNGLGDDFPRLGPRLMREDAGRIILQPNMSFTLKPVLRFPTGTATQFGDPVVITEGGARRLGKRARQPVIIE